MCFDFGFGPFRWVCTSADPTDLAESDRIAADVVRDLAASAPEETKQQYAAESDLRSPQRALLFLLNPSPPPHRRRRDARRDRAARRRGGRHVVAAPPPPRPALRRARRRRARRRARALKMM